MKKAFTLIELLVVIAIIAILAAILFPVFAQAKAAAKKTAALSNQKQISTSMFLYTSDYDDIYPRNDDCVSRSSLNSALNAGTYTPSNGDGCSGAGPYPYRMNHYAWQKWVLPYTKNVQLFEHPGRQKLDSGTPAQWSTNGQLMGGFALNLGVTGAVNTYLRADTAAGRLRNSIFGGNQTALPSVAEAMLLFEFSNPLINYAPVVLQASESSSPNQTVYPAAIREFWASNFFKTDASCNSTGVVDSSRVFSESIVVGYADGHAKSIKPQAFLGNTPTAAEYGVTLTSGQKCGISSGTIAGQPTPNTNLNYPFWGFQGQ
jgi:prepilin-type N-terminal cleavage/methylation domain-containing protein